MTLRALLWLALRPLIGLGLGLSVAGRGNVPACGPAILAANHNSHVDIVALMGAVPVRALAHVRPVGAADYFFAGPVTSWLSRRLLGALPLARTVRRGTDPLAPLREALNAGAILILFPEGTRGEAEILGPLKAGLSKLARDTGAPVIPVYLQGAGRILPKGTRLPVPFTVTCLIGPPLPDNLPRQEMMDALGTAFADLKDKAPPLHWH